MIIIGVCIFRAFRPESDMPTAPIQRARLSRNLRRAGRSICMSNMQQEKLACA